MVLDHCGIFHSKLTSGLSAVRGQVDLHAVAGRLDVADVDQARQRRRPQTGDRTAAGVQGQVVLAVEPARAT